jgi:ABC-type oligopeptide transport system ATPase subunit
MKNGKIINIGKFTKEEVDNAVHQYITERYARIISPILQLRDKKGKKIHTEESALRSANESLTKNYFVF